MAIFSFFIVLFILNSYDTTATATKPAFVKPARQGDGHAGAGGALATKSAFAKAMADKKKGLQYCKPRCINIDPAHTALFTELL
jgi:hypothetical protein